MFVDGQNLFHAARAAFDRTYPDYDVHALGRAICASNGWAPSEIRFYTGLPEPSDNARWYRFWMANLAAMGRQGVYVVSRPLRYRNQTVRLPTVPSTPSWLERRRASTLSTFVVR